MYHQTDEGWLPMDEDVVTEPEEIELEEIALDELGLLSEQLAQHQIQSERRHTEILECLNRLENSSQTTENPSFQAMLTEVATLKTEVAELKGMIASLNVSLMAMSHSHHQPGQLPNDSETPTPEVENPAEQNQERSIEEPAPVGRKKHRIL
jgi:hypothetical protein